MTWIFGYGSLIWKPGFAYLERAPALLRGWERRFWQGSTDHRGVPGAPGRVVTLHESPGGECRGVAYSVEPAVLVDLLPRLDHREKGGYVRRDVELELGDGRRVAALVYLATAENANYLGPAPLQDIARQIAASEGPSGRNDEYLLRLAEALRELGVDDPHVTALERLLPEGDLSKR